MAAARLTGGGGGWRGPKALISVARQPRARCLLSAARRGADGERCKAAGNAPRRAGEPQGAPRRRRGRSLPVPKPRAAASASGAPLGTRYSKGAARCLTGTCVRPLTPGDPVTDGTSVGGGAAPFVGTARASVTTSPRWGSLRAAPPPPSDSTVDAKDRAELARRPPQRAGPRGRRAE